jgi:hypothetical protein
MVVARHSRLQIVQAEVGNWFVCQLTGPCYPVWPGLFLSGRSRISRKSPGVGISTIQRIEGEDGFCIRTGGRVAQCSDGD